MNEISGPRRRPDIREVSLRKFPEAKYSVVEF